MSKKPENISEEAVEVVGDHDAVMAAVAAVGETDDEGAEQASDEVADEAADEAAEDEATADDSESQDSGADAEESSESRPASEVSVDELAEDRPAEDENEELRAILEAVVYVTDEPLTAQQIAAALELPIDRVHAVLTELVDEYNKPSRGLSIREVAGGYRMSTKAEHHESVRAFVKKLTPPLKLSLAALETLAVIAYKQPVTAPEIMDIRGVQGAGVLKTLLDRKLITEAGRKNVVGKPILYKTTKEFLVQFGLKNVKELPSLKEFEELGRMELVEEAMAAEEASTEESPAAEASTDGASAEGTSNDGAEAGEPVAEEPAPEAASEAASGEVATDHETSAKKPPAKKRLSKKRLSKKRPLLKRRAMKRRAMTSLPKTSHK